MPKIIKNNMIIALIFLIILITGCSNNIKSNNLNEEKNNNQEFIDDINNNAENIPLKNKINNSNSINEKIDITILSSDIKIDNIKRITTSDPQVYAQIIKEQEKEEYILFVKMYFSENQQYTMIQDKYVSTVPLAINVVCGIYAEIVYQKLLPDENINIEPEIFKEIKDKKINQVIISFDEEKTENKIAKCEIIGPEWEDITFHEYKFYEETFLDSKIGVK